MSEQREFQGVWIPREIYLREDLSWTEKILLIEIQNFCNGEKGCFASNEYFAKFLNCSVGSIANMLTKLRNLGLVETINFDGRKRILQTNLYEGRVHKNMKSAFINLGTHTSQNYEHINIDVTNKVNNTNNKEKIIKKESSQIQIPDVLPLEVPLEEIEKWLSYKKEIKKPYKTQRGLNTAISELAKLVNETGLTAKEIIDFSIAREYQGFFAPLKQKQLTNQQTYENNTRNKNEILTPDERTKLEQAKLEYARQQQQFEGLSFAERIKARRKLLNNNSTTEGF